MIIIGPQTSFRTGIESFRLESYQESEEGYDTTFCVLLSSIQKLQTLSTTESVATMIAEAIAKAIGIAIGIAKLWNDA